MENVPCNVCGANDASQLYIVAGYSVVICNRCRLIYVNPQPGTIELKEFYEKDFFSGEWYDKFPQFKGYNYFDKTFDEIEGFKDYIYGIQKYKRTGKLLDVGCGDGWLLKHAVDNGFQAYGVEPALRAFKEARAKIGPNVYNDTLERASFKDDFFDVVISVGTIEHLKDPLSLLKETHRILRANGLIVIQTPNIDSYLSKIQGAKWEQFIVPAHLYFFSPKTLKLILETAGFEVLSFDMRVPLFSKLNYGASEKQATVATGRNNVRGLSRKMKNVLFALLGPLKPALKPPYEFLCNLKGRIMGKHDMVVYARKVTKH